jgi:hypothetical protein
MYLSQIKAILACLPVNLSQRFAKWVGGIEVEVE